jgi:GDP-4-dehydro-6-deoxy-D-mannose reductase
MRVLVTGAAGFAGRYLLRELLATGHTPVAFDTLRPDDDPDIPFHLGDLTDPASLQACMEAVKPDACVHLAGVAFVPMGWSHPTQVMTVNLNGTLNLLEAIRKQAPACRTLVVTSSEVYGREARPEPVREEDELHPSNLYGISKMAADQAARLYSRHHGMHIMTARPQNHIGPGQSRLFVVSAFTEQLLALKRGGNGAMKVGNLEARRDFTDVRDVARAYRLLIEKGHAGEAYNIASGHLRPIHELLEILCEEADFHPKLEIDPDLYRPTDAPPLLCIEKIKAHTGWEPAIPLQETLRGIYQALAK